MTLFGLTACGVKTPVIAPDMDLPDPVSGFELFVRDDRLLLAWTPPKEKAPGEVTAYKVFYEDAWAAEQSRGRQFRELASVNQADDLALRRRDGRMVLDLPVDARWAGKVFNYVVVPVGRKGYAGPESPVVSIYWAATPEPPGSIDGEAGDRSARLRWSPPAVPGVGYNLYRTLEGEPFPLHPVNGEPLREAHYVDRQVRNGETYLYTVRTVGSAAPPWIESRGSDPARVRPVDLKAPEPPKRLEAIAGVAIVRLLWQENEEGDLAGYRVYRRGPGENRSVKIGEVLQPVTLFTDREIQRGSVYEYHVTAFDQAPGQNESGPSKSVKIEAP
ncbi:MAG: fibronectin type III domain-containing protein [bacterium]|nr:fibronectin type III domain-containing protein [bacterium]